MYTQEGDFENCCAAIRSQSGVTVTHHVISGLKEKEAHNALWAAWRSAQRTHDVFVKVDADTVLASDTTLMTICELFERDRRVTGLQAPLHDHMTDDLINGLNAFSPVVVFNDTRDDLYCDRQVDVGHDIVIRVPNLPDSLVPAGRHCHFSTDRQAFHYGLHRMLKNQTTIIDRVRTAWKRDRDRIRAYALMGAQFSYRFTSDRKFNYDDAEFNDAFHDAEKHYDTDTALGRLDRIR